MLPSDPLANVLYVDLSKKRSWLERREDLFGKYFGGAGVGIQLLTENCPAGMDPLAPEAPIVLTTGPLDGLFPLGIQDRGDVQVAAHRQSGRVACGRP